jgi:hypothetical protein
MLVYTKQKIALSVVLGISVLANGWFMWRYWVNVPAAERAKYDYLFPGFIKEAADLDVDSALRFSYVWVVNDGHGGFELVLADRHNCQFITTLPLSPDQLVEPRLYNNQAILVDEFQLMNGKIVLSKVRQDSFATQHKEELLDACPVELRGKVNAAP